MNARELLSLPPAEWAEVVEVMSWRELREVAEAMRRAARRVHQLERFTLEAARVGRQLAERGDA